MAIKIKSNEFNEYVVVWAPTGQVIKTVRAKDALSARKKTPAPYKKYMGEVYAELKSEREAKAKC